MKKAIVLFGASALGTVAYKSLKEQYEIVYYLDNDKNKWGNKLNSIKIKSPHEIDLLANKYEIVITSQYHVAIAYQLLSSGIKKFGVYNSNKSEIEYYDYSDINNITRSHNVITLVAYDSSGSNTYALYKRIPQKIKEKYEINLIFEKNKNNNYYLDLFRSTLVVYTHDNFYMDDQINVQLFHGFPLKAISYMSKYENTNKKYNNEMWSKLDVITSYSQTYSTILNACYGVDGKKYTITGMPRNDLLLSADGKKNLENVLKKDLQNKNIFVYMPTYRETIFGEKSGDEASFDIFSMKDFAIKELESFLAKTNSILIVKLHPLHLRQLSDSINFNQVENIYHIDDNILRNYGLDFYELINATDILITDYSSVYFDYLLLDRPIIFTPLDLTTYEETRGFLVKPYEFWAPGSKCYTLKELLIEINRCLNNPSDYSKERQLVRNIVHHYKDSNSSERVWDVIDSLMEEKA